MSATPARAADRLPLPGLPNPPARSRRTDVIAAAGVAVALAHLILAPATLALAAVAAATGRLTRWRPLWLAAPAAGGAAWTAAIGVPRALAGLAAGPRRLVGYLAGLPGHPVHLQDAGQAMTQAAHLLPGQVPAGLLAASAEVAGLAWLAGRQQAFEADWRPGLMAIVRRQRTRAVLAAGHTATRTGFSLGLDPASGRFAELSWAAAGRGVLVSCTGSDEAARLSFPALSAALARRMTVIVIDLTASDRLATALVAACEPQAIPLTCLRPAPPGHWRAVRPASTGPISSVPGSIPPLRPGTAGALRSAVSQAVRDREVVVATLEPAMPDPAATAAGEHAVSSLAAVLRELRDHGLGGDCLAWVHGCQVARPAALAGLLELGPGSGTAILLSTASDAAAATLAGRAAAVVAGGPVAERLAARLAAWPDAGPAGSTSPASAGLAARLRQQPEGEFSIADHGAGLRTACRQVPPAAAPRAGYR
jgi:hypothetical protein